VSPIDSSSIPVEVRVNRVNQPSPDTLTLSGTIDIHDIRLTQTGEMRIGVVDVIILQQDETGKVLSESTDQLNLRFTEEQYSAMLKSGIQFRKTMQPKSGAATLRVLVQDPSTAAIGSLVIPLSQLKYPLQLPPLLPTQAPLCYKLRAMQMLVGEAPAIARIEQDAPTEQIKGSDRASEHPSLFCPVCSARLAPRKCKLICNACGYYMSCSDYY
jgi:hypothetical protein